MSSDGQRSRIDDAPILAPRVFCVVLHDVAGGFQPEMRKIVEQVSDLLDGCFACAVVPSWHGEDDKHGMAEVVSVCGGCEEWMIHGMTHRRVSGGLFVSWLTNGSDEFGGMELAEIQERVLTSQENIRALTGIKSVGLVAPCWSLPVNPDELDGIDYVMGYNCLVPCRANANAGKVPVATVRLATWSYDWGRIPSVASLVNVFPSWRFQLIQDVVPCVVIHPADVARGWLPVAASRIQKLLTLGYRPVTPQKLMLAESVSAS